MSKETNYAEWLYGIALILTGVILAVKGVESVVYMLTVENPDQDASKVDFLPVLFIGLVVAFLIFRGVKKIQKERRR
mgnify:CR=1 FL=1